MTHIAGSRAARGGGLKTTVQEGTKRAARAVTLASMMRIAGSRTLREVAA
jgi:hypothetical protein